LIEHGLTSAPTQYRLYGRRDWFDTRTDQQSTRLPEGRGFNVYTVYGPPQATVGMLKPTQPPLPRIREMNINLRWQSILRQRRICMLPR